MTTHRFQPTRYYNTIGSHEPVLHIADGDTVITTTVDARGWDSQGNQAATRGNPQPACCANGCNCAKIVNEG